MIKKLLFIFLLQLSLVSCVCNQTKNRLIASRDSIANHTDKFITFKGLELKHGIQMADALKALEAKGLKRSEQFDYKKRNYHIYSLRGHFISTEIATLRFTQRRTTKTSLAQFQYIPLLI